jgi:DNA-binding NtrC family response regulator
MKPQILRRLLVVDDEQHIVSAVRRELTTPPLGRYRYEVEGFSDPLAALERARVQEFDAVITDFRMPVMDGLAFLKAFAALQPDCARLVLSGQTELDALVRMVNELHIYRFIPKPWHDYYLKSSVGQAIAFQSALAANRRLADKARACSVPLPPVAGKQVEQLLVVHADPGALAGLTRVLSGRTPVDELFAAIRTEVANDDGAALDESYLSVETTSSALQALKLADDLSFAGIVVGHRLPEMSGIDLLQEFADKQPDCARVLLGGELGKDDLIDAVDGAHIHCFVAEPWQDYALKACIAQALAQRRMQIENRMLAEMVRTAGGGED